jgi:hypothetical protein
VSRYGYLRPHLPPLVTDQCVDRHGGNPHKSQSVDSALGYTWDYADRSTNVEVELAPDGVASVSVRFHSH